MSKITIEIALDNLLSTLTGVGDINLSGLPYTPKRGMPFVSSRLSGYTRQPAGVGRDCVFQINGTYQVIVYRPASEGKVAAGQVATKVMGLFSRRAVVITSDGRVVNLLNATEAPDTENADWIQVPVLISFFTSEP